MRAFTTGHPDWLTVIQLPAYAPDLNPVEGAWSVMKNSLGNLAPGTTGQLAAAMRHQLDRIQATARPHYRIPRPDRSHPRAPATVVSRGNRGLWGTVIARWRLACQVRSWRVIW
jgi:hypothetical protein